MIVRVKRPNLQREQLENQSFQSGTIMLGTLDPYEHDQSIYNNIIMLVY